jgi:hypothetical protein
MTATPDPAFAEALAEADRVLDDLAEDAETWLFDGAIAAGMAPEFARIFATRQAARMRAEAGPRERQREALRHVRAAGRA